MAASCSQQRGQPRAEGLEALGHVDEHRADDRQGEQLQGAAHLAFLAEEQRERLAADDREEDRADPQLQGGLQLVAGVGLRNDNRCDLELHDVLPPRVVLCDSGLRCATVRKYAWWLDTSAPPARGYGLGADLDAFE